MSKLTNIDWWMGRTAEQQAAKTQAKADLRALRQESPKEGNRLTRWGINLTLFITLPLIGFAIFGFIGAGLALILAFVLKR